ncbi:MAG: phosphate ABC transporter substrate-binding protein [Elusimicrobia bacterium]|nr:phosphate ABC transporter substrate-binding protein [Elusimicrobiota bacterium]MBP9127979.1 phosphate ABC transporter substrate-binding protein [Elusimicrobiota bacterium]
MPFLNQLETDRFFSVKKFFSFLLSAIYGFSVTASEAVTIKGSDTMVILNQRWAEKYMFDRPSAVIQVTGGGSGTGIAALLGGATDICASSRPMKEKERVALQAKTGRSPIEIAVAKDGIAIYLNEANPLRELTLEQVALIYRGKITNWRDLGGADQKIILYSRENNSGTYEFFKEHVLKKKDFTPFAQCLPGTASVANAVARDKRGIGYGGAAYAKGIRFCAIKPDAATPGILPNETHILDGSYPVSRNLFFYLRDEPAGAINNFVDFVLSPEGQAIVAKVGYYPIGSPQKQ